MNVNVGAAKLFQKICTCKVVAHTTTPITF